MVQKEDLPEWLSVFLAPFDFFLKKTVQNLACHLCFEGALYRLLYIFRLYRHGKQQVQKDQMPLHRNIYHQTVKSLLFQEQEYHWIVNVHLPLKIHRYTEK